MTSTAPAGAQAPAHDNTTRRPGRSEVARGSQPAGISWAGRMLSAIAVIFLAMDATMKVLMLGPAIETTMQLGYPEHIVFALGLIEVVCLTLYLIPRTSVIGALLWTGYLGGAVATHVRVESPLFTHTLFPIYIAALLWGGLWLRDARVRRLLSTST